MVIRPLWGRDEHTHDGGEVQKMLKFEKQTHRGPEGRELQSSAEAGVAERKSVHLC